MKTRIFILLCIPFVLFSCEKASHFGIPAPDGLVEVHATITGNATKVMAVDAENGLDWNWEEGDQIAIASGDVLGLFNIREGFGPKEASFIGSQISGEKFNISYPAISAEEMGALSLTGQKQTGNGDKSHLQYFALLENVDNYTEFAFSPENEGFRQCGVLHFSLVLPDEAAVVNSVSLRAPEAIFHTGNADGVLMDALSIEILEGAVGSDHTFEAWMTTSWFEDAIPAGTKLEVNVIAGDNNWIADITPSTNKAVKPGYVNNVKVADASMWAVGSRYAAGEGTEENPWQIKTAGQLMCVHEDLVEEQITYFQLIADIDLTGYEWVPLNPTGPYKKYISFDGQGHTISNLTITQPTAYPSFAGVLYGTLQNVSFSNASINAGNNKAGVVAGYMGTADAFIPSVARNVTVRNSNITGMSSMGGFVGQTGSDDSLFENCRVENTTVSHTGTGNYHVGGFVGRAQKAGKYTDCSAEATVIGTQFAGGFAGYIEKGTYTNCSSTSTVTASFDAGGFVGKADAGSLVDCWYAGPGVTCTKAEDLSRCGGFIGYANKSGSSFTGCYVKNTTVNAPDGYSNGGFAGLADEGNKFTKCYAENVTVNGGQLSAGFVGTDQCDGISMCHVDGGVLNPSGVGITDDGVGAAGFVAYTENAKILNSYTSMAISGNWGGVGGFVAYVKAKTTIQYCYSESAIESTTEPVGIFGAYVEDLEGISINKCIGWSSTLNFIDWLDGGDVSDNYCGTEGTVSSQAVLLGWDPDIWDFSAKLK